MRARRATAARGVRLAAVALATLAVSAAGAQRIALPPVAREALPNGTRVLLMEYRRAPSVVVSVTFPGGDATDPAGKSGATSLMAALLRRGTHTRTAPQIAEAIDFVGGSLDAAAGDDRVVVSLNVLTQYLDTGLDLMADIIRNPTFPPEELARERDLALAGLAALPEDPGAVADRVATEVVYAGHPYGVQPTMASLRAIEAADVLAAYRRIVVPDRAIVVAVGDFRSADMLARLKKRFADWPRANTPEPAIAAVRSSAPRTVFVDKPDATQTQVRFVRTGLPRRTPLDFQSRVANAILGGGFTSRLTEQVRVNRSLTYGIGSGFEPHLHGGEFIVSTFTRIDTTRALLDATRSVLEQAAARGFTPEELSRVKGYEVGIYAIRVQTPEAMAGELADMAFYGLPEDYLTTYPARLRAVTLDQADAVARSFFPPAGFSLIMVGPAAKAMPQLKGLGNIETRPIESIGQEPDPAGRAKTEDNKVDEKTKERIDRWIKDTGRNQFGDPAGTMYAGGTPLFDERTGRRKDRYEYILERHPELRKK